MLSLLSNRVEVSQTRAWEKSHAHVCNVPSEDQIGGVTKPPELAESLRSGSAHRVDHLLSQPNRGQRQGLSRIAAEQIGKVHVEEFSVVGDQQIVQMPVADAQHVSHDAVSRATLAKVTYHGFQG